jgi:LCP family protein required for cell wall assembly
MHAKFIKLILILTVVSLLAACNAPPLVGAPAAVSMNSENPVVAQATATLVQAPSDATPTATPFQPLPPTAVYLPTNTPLPTATPLPPTPTLAPAPQEVSSAGSGAFNQPAGQINILLLGSDQRPWDRVFRTDTIILATLNPKAGTVHLTSFPRDLYITIPGYGFNRINTAWQMGGFDLLARTFKQNFGVRPDHYVLINFSSFKKVIDSLGGLEVEVAQSVSDYRAGRWVTIPAGTVQMDADTVLWYVRTRKTTNDFARGRRQQEVLQALYRKMLTLDAIKRVPEFYDIYKDNVTTDLGFTDIIRLLPLAAKITDTSHIKHYYIGPQQVWDWITPGGGMVLLPRPDAIQAVLRKALNAE